MHKEDVDVAYKLRKDYRAYLGKGIPDPWIFPYAPRHGIPSCKGLKENLKKYFLPLFDRTKNKENCYCCEKNYLLECPDKSDSKYRSCTCKECHYKNTEDHCKCIDILHTWVSQNIHLEERRPKKEKEEKSKGEREKERGERRGVRSKWRKFHRSSLDGCETDDEESNATSRICICPGNLKKSKESISSRCSNVSCVEQQSKDFFCKVCNSSKQGFGFPYIKKNKYVPFKRAVSKEIQTDIIGDSKIVQTENAKSKIPNNNKCFKCNMYQQSKCKVYPFDQTLCISPSVVQNHAIICPYACHNYMPDNQPYCIDSLKKKHPKKKKEKSSGDYVTHSKMESISSKTLKTSEAQLLENLLKTNEPKDRYQPSLKNFRNLKYLTDKRLKNYLRMRENLQRCKANQCLNETVDQSDFHEEFYSSQKPEKFKFSLRKPGFVYSCANTPGKANSVAKFVNEGVTIGCEEGVQKSRLITKYFNDLHDSDESRIFGLVRNHGSRKRRKLVCSRKRRKLVSRERLENGGFKLVNKNTQVEREGLARNEREIRRKIFECNLKFKDAGDTQKKCERGTSIEFFEQPLSFKDNCEGLGKVLQKTPRRHPDILKFTAVDYLTNEKPKI